MPTLGGAVGGVVWGWQARRPRIPWAKVEIDPWPIAGGILFSAEALALGTLSGAVAVLVGFAAGLLLRIVWIEWLEAHSVRARDIR